MNRAVRMKAGERLRFGDLIVIKPVAVSRKWYQFWLPREWTEDRAFRAYPDSETVNGVWFDGAITVQGDDRLTL